MHWNPGDRVTLSHVMADAKNWMVGARATVVQQRDDESTYGEHGPYPIKLRFDHPGDYPGGAPDNIWEAYRRGSYAFNGWWVHEDTVIALKPVSDTHAAW